MGSRIDFGHRQHQRQVAGHRGRSPSESSRQISCDRCKLFEHRCSLDCEKLGILPMRPRFLQKKLNLNAGSTQSSAIHCLQILQNAHEIDIGLSPLSIAYLAQDHG